MDISKVVVDDCDGAFRAVEHLILSGYKRIAHLAGPEHISVSRDRLRGYTLALQKHNLNFHQDLVVHGGFDEEDGTSGFQKLLKSGSLPDAIFAVNDLVAIGVFLEIKKRGLRIPDDLALVGFGDVPAASLIEPPLTTVGQHPYQMGQLAATLLLEKIEDTQGSVTTKQHVLKTELIIRGSTQTVKRPVDGT